MDWFYILIDWIFYLKLKQIQMYQNQLPTSLSIFTLLEKHFLLTASEKESVDFYKQWVVFITRIRLSAEPVCKEFKNSKKSHKFYTGSLFFKSYINQLLHENISSRHNLAP